MNQKRYERIKHLYFLFLQTFRYIFLMFYLFLGQRETEHERGRGRERGRHRIGNRLQVPSCQHRARHGAQTHELWDHDLSWSQPLNWLSHPGAPHSSACCCPVLPAPFAKETVFFPLDTLSCFVEDWLAIHLWVQFWVLYSIPLVYVSVFVPITYHLDDYNFVVEAKV